MKKLIWVIAITLCVGLIVIPYSAMAQDTNKAWDDANAIKRDSNNAQKEAEKGNYESTREQAGKGFDDYTSPHQGNSNYDIPSPGEPVIDNE